VHQHNSWEFLVVISRFEIPRRGSNPHSILTDVPV
jgi:hypothetical protein